MCLELLEEAGTRWDQFHVRWQMAMHSRQVARRWKRLCHLHEVWVRETMKLPRTLDRSRVSSQRRASCDRYCTVVPRLISNIKVHTVWTEFCSTLAASGAASGEVPVVHASGQRHRSLKKIGVMTHIAPSNNCYNLEFLMAAALKTEKSPMSLLKL